MDIVPDISPSCHVKMATKWDTLTKLVNQKGETCTFFRRNSQPNGADGTPMIPLYRRSPSIRRAESVTPSQKATPCPASHLSL